MRQTLAFVVLAAVIIGTTYGALTLSAAETKFNICHKEGNGKGHVIIIAESALKAHYAHGDSGVAGWQKAGDACQLPVLK